MFVSVHSYILKDFKENDCLGTLISDRPNSRILFSGSKTSEGSVLDSLSRPQW